jgi:hypothetical protein
MHRRARQIGRVGQTMEAWLHASYIRFQALMKNSLGLKAQRES